MLIKGFLDGLKPDPILTVSEWADANRILDSQSASMPGRYRTSVTPFSKEIMDNLGEYSEVEEVIVMKGAQLGITENGLNWIGYTIDISPCPMLLVEPTKEVVELVSKTRIQPMLESTPALTKKVKPARSRDSGNTLTKKEFPGGILRLAGANSAAGLRNMPVKRLMLDEVDAYPVDLDSEGNPIDLAIKRTSTFARRKIFILSTPTTKGNSVIEPLFEATDKRYYFVPCPHCGGMQHLKWEQLRYEYNSKSRIAKNVFYECEHCLSPIAERHKSQMLAAGQWIATAPENENSRRVGYHLNSLYSPLGWLSWRSIAENWEESQGDVPKLKTFYNTVLGLTYEETGDKPEWKNLYERREDYPVNRIPVDDVAFLTAGVDIQKDRIELEIVGWCEGKTSYSIDYRVLTGFVAGDGSAQVWQKLAAVLNETWQKPNGVTLPIRLMCVDSGYSSTEVYSFCRNFPPSRVIPVKGKDNLNMITSSPKAVNVTRKNKAVDSVKVWMIGTNLLKSELYGWLRLAKEENGYCHFPQYDENYFKGLTAEELVITKDKKGRDKQEWVKKYRRNEPLDVRIYNRAAAHIVGIDTFTPAVWHQMRTGQVKKKIKIKKSTFL
ncbi:MAG: phage terminase large subunit family protein [Chitinophagaceae bacterium]|nr:phage terminase large subunit family protein [Chitinophagaceae bacterium]